MISNLISNTSKPHLTKSVTCPSQLVPDPKNSDNIFASIIDKYLLTPKIYEKYLQELVLEEKSMSGIIQDVFLAPEFTFHLSSCGKNTTSLVKNLKRSCSI